MMRDLLVLWGMMLAGCAIGAAIVLALPDPEPKIIRPDPPVCTVWPVGELTDRQLVDAARQYCDSHVCGPE